MRNAPPNFLTLTFLRLCLNRIQEIIKKGTASLIRMMSQGHPLAVQFRLLSTFFSFFLLANMLSGTGITRIRQQSQQDGARMSSDVQSYTNISSSCVANQFMFVYSNSSMLCSMLVVEKVKYLLYFIFFSLNCKGFF